MTADLNPRTPDTLLTSVLDSLLQRVYELERSVAVNLPSPMVPYAGGFSGGWGVGNGSLSSMYARLGGDLVRCEITFVAGSTSAYGGPCRFLLPFPPVRYTTGGTGSLWDVSTGVISPVAMIAVDPVGPYVTPFAMAAVTQINNGGITASFPWTWAAGDEARLVFDYEPA